MGAHRARLGKKMCTSMKGSVTWGAWVGGASRDPAGEKCRVWVARGSLMGAEMSEWLQGSSGSLRLSGSKANLGAANRGR